MIFFIFGSLTVFAGGRALFSEIGITTRGNIVPLVLWFNFLAGFFYLIASILAFKMKSSIKGLSKILAFSNTMVLLYLLIHIFQGGLFENRTVFAMTFRTSFWIAAAIYFHRIKYDKFNLT